MKMNKKYLVAALIVGMIGIGTFMAMSNNSNAEEKGIALTKVVGIDTTKFSVTKDKAVEKKKVNDAKDDSKKEAKKEETKENEETTVSKNEKTNNVSEPSYQLPVAEQPVVEKPNVSPSPAPQPTPEPEYEVPVYVPTPQPQPEPQPSYACPNGYDKNLPCDYVDPSQFGSAGIVFKTINEADIWCQENISMENILHYSVQYTEVYDNTNRVVGYAITNNSIYRK